MVGSFPSEKAINLGPSFPTIDHDMYPAWRRPSPPFPPYRDGHVWRCFTGCPQSLQVAEVCRWHVYPEPEAPLKRFVTWRRGETGRGTVGKKVRIWRSSGAASGSSSLLFWTFPLLRLLSCCPKLPSFCTLKKMCTFVGACEEHLHSFWS